MDARYRSKSVTDNLSKWLRDRVKSFPKLQDGCNSLKTFIEHNKSRILTDAKKPFSEENETAAMDIDQPVTHDPPQAIAQTGISVVNKENDDGFVVFTDVKNEPTDDVPMMGESITCEAKKLSTKFSYG